MQIKKVTTDDAQESVMTFFRPRYSNNKLGNRKQLQRNKPQHGFIAKHNHSIKSNFLLVI